MNVSVLCTKLRPSMTMFAAGLRCVPSTEISSRTRGTTTVGGGLPSVVFGKRYSFPAASSKNLRGPGPESGTHQPRPARTGRSVPGLQFWDSSGGGGGSAPLAGLVEQVKLVLDEVVERPALVARRRLEAALREGHVRRPPVGRLRDAADAGR